MNAGNQKIFTRDELVNWAGAELVAAAENALDIQSVSAFKYDARGRIEGVVKPAPPSTEKPAFARITRRGARLALECRMHGKGQWCLHGVVLALHHLGVKPVFKQKTAKPKDLPQIGYRLEMEADPRGPRFFVRVLSRNSLVPGFLHFIKKEGGVVGLSRRMTELFEDLGEEQEDGLFVPRVDAATVLTALAKTTLFPRGGTKPFAWRQENEAPTLGVKISDGEMMWRLEEAFGADAVCFPGRPGFMIVGSTITYFRQALADLQPFLAKTSGAQPVAVDTLAALARQKHGIQWHSPKPRLVTEIQGAGLDFSVHQRDLHGQAGVWADGRFLALNNLDQPRQLLQDEKGPVLLQLDKTQMNLLGRTFRDVQAPWGTNSFRIREGMAGRFLEDMQLPDRLQVRNKNAGAWFGVQPMAMSVEWSKGSLAPQYRIGGELFGHETLMDGLVSGRSMVQLGSGQRLNVDVDVILEHEEILNGVRALHEDESKQKSLLQRILETKAGRAPSVAAAVETAPLSEAWHQRLRHYQVDGVQWLLANHGAGEPSLLADDMGLGKTVQTLAYLETVREPGRPQLVVAPTTLLGNWAAEAAKFTPNRKVTIHHGPKRIREAELLNKQDLIITSYGLVLRDLDLFYDVHFQAVVLDEAQAIKNPSAQTSQAVFELWTDHRLALTGTPVENRLTELWSIFQFLAPGYLGDEEDVKAITMPGTPAFNALKTKVGPFLKRRLKSEVEKDLPEKQEITVRLPLNDGQAALYRDVLLKSKKELKQQGINAVSLLSRLLRLRQICCHPGLVDDLHLTASSCKFDFLLESLSEVTAGGHGALVFSQFTSLLQLLRYELEERDIPYLYLDGATRNRDELVKQFQAGVAPVFLISLKAGGTGLTLTRASYVYHLDPWWNPMVEAQATDRAYRIGQTKKVISYKLIAEGTIEERILKLQASKKLVAEGLWRDADQLFESLDRETMLALLEE
ncbi:DEAD/DEAH box helicase [Acanthopleuribacter pedis]|uniref:DEAD/DEAH box helicase n=1 Tax=Acanthopleuribacter pedis TaxID=442870 RepID=A0A8J7QIR1_9BACT|nr:DEAD/DEAH box helicase [Acanthopleuribacter pedis]MBO1321506.1 DEAD/DEAH box helicase [Acanthopleuribacter pedis]